MFCNGSWHGNMGITPTAVERDERLLRVNTCEIDQFEQRAHATPAYCGRFTLNYHSLCIRCIRSRIQHLPNSVV